MAGLRGHRWFGGRRRRLRAVRFHARDEDGLDPAWGVTSLRVFVVDDEGPVVCAETFSEFLYRYWIENDICHRADTGEPFTPEQRRYLDHYAGG